MMSTEDQSDSQIRQMDAISISFLIWTLTLSIFGCIGNTMVIGAVLVHKKLRRLPNVFVTNLAVADSLITAFVAWFAMVGIVTDGHFFVDKTVLCNFIGAVCITACSCSLWSVASISLNRYVIICHRMVYPKIYNRKTVPFMIAGIWLTCFLVDLPNLVGWGRHGFDERLQMCTYDYTYEYSYTIFFIIVGLALPICVSVVSYLNILRHFKQSNQILVRRSVASTRYNQSIIVQKQIHADRRLLKSVLVILVVFVVMWIPHSVMALGDYRIRWPRVFHVIAAGLAHGNSSINCLIYAAYNRDFRRGYVRFMKVVYYRALRCKKHNAIKPTYSDDTTPNGTNNTKTFSI